MLFLLATAVQCVILYVALVRDYESVWILYWPVSLLNEVFPIPARSEADVWAGAVFLLPVVVFYSLVLTALVAVIKNRYGR